MRITNKIMQNNSLYNINNNKVTEDQLNTMMSTGKKLTRPSDDPVIAIRALRLRSNVTQLNQYYEKNAKDAQSWLEVTADALSTITAVLTDSVKQATKGASKDLTLDDLDTIITQMDSLANEYYSTGNVDYAGRYVFTGYRTDTPLTYDRTTTANYTDINDEFNAENIGTSTRILNKYKLDSTKILDPSTETVYEHDIVDETVGRLRLSYDNLNYRVDENNTALLKYREELTLPATSTVDSSCDALNLTYQTKEGITRSVCIPIDEKADYTVSAEGYKYTSSIDDLGNYRIIATDESTMIPVATFTVNREGILEKFTGEVDSGMTTLETKQVSTITYTDDVRTSVKVPLIPAIGQTYTITLDKDGFTATINSDGTYTVRNNSSVQNDDGTYTNTIINVTGNGSVNSSYNETTYEFDYQADNIIYSTCTEAEIDSYYEAVASGKKLAVLNATTGEVLLAESLTNKLSTLPNLINAKSIDVVYDKKEWVKGDLKPENLFNCAYTDENGKTILYNRGSAPHDIAYDVGFAQSVVVNTTADEVFTTSVKRDVQDLRRILDELKQVDSTLTNLKSKLNSDLSQYMQDKINAEIDATQKSYNYLRESLQKEFEKKITSNQKSLDVANIAVTSNGTKSKRLDLVNQRLMNQTTTFKTLQSDNEDIDLAETATQLTTAQVTYEASLVATGKISQSSLINYI